MEGGTDAEPTSDEKSGVSISDAGRTLDLVKDVLEGQIRLSLWQGLLLLLGENNRRKVFHACCQNVFLDVKILEKEEILD